MKTRTPGKQTSRYFDARLLIKVCFKFDDKRLLAVHFTVSDGVKNKEREATTDPFVSGWKIVDVDVNVGRFFYVLPHCRPVNAHAEQVTYVLSTVAVAHGISHCTASSEQLEPS